MIADSSFSAYRSLEEMDTIFQKTTSIFNVVQVAKDEPRRYGKNGELLIDYEQTDEHRRRASRAEERRASMASTANDRSAGLGQAEKGNIEEKERI